MTAASDLIVLGEDWGGHPSSTQHLIRRLVADRRVLWVNSIGLRWPRATLADMARVAAKLRAAIAPQAVALSVADNARPTAVVNPLALPVARNHLAQSLNRLVLGGQVRRAAKRAGLHRPILWTSLPTGGDLADAFGAGPVVYYCGDDFGALAGVDHGPVLAAEARLAARADLIIAASENLAAKFPAARTVTLPHGADISLFAADADRAPDLPVGRRIAGFYGSLSDWIDVETIAGAADHLPHWEFVLVGDVRTDVSALKSRPNIRFMGPRPHANLPAYVRHWDVSLIPFRDNEQIRACNPLKLREYLAAGRPIVTSDFPALNGYRDLVHLAAGPTSFANAIVAAARDDDDGSRAARLARVAGESWEDRAARVSDLLACL